MPKLNKKIAIAVSAAAIVTIGGGTAFAYWTTTGSGSGSATTASSNGTIDLQASFADGVVTPGSDTPVSFTASNAGSSSLRVGTVHTVVSASGTCDATWFTVADVVENQTIAAGATDVTLTNQGSIVFADSASDQDACKGATITLTLTSN
jgi:hypothetical protein